MANGTHVVLPRELEPSSTNTSIGEAVAQAIVASCCAVADFWAGGSMRPETRMANGTCIARLYELQQSAPDGIDFPAVVRREGKYAINARYSAIFRAAHGGADIPEPMLDLLLDDLLAVLARVTEVERRLAH
jgi:hypothetical protein